MRQEVLDFYNSKNLPIRRMVSKGAMRGLSAESIQAAAEELYGEIECGRSIRDIRIAWAVFDKAKHIAPKIKEDKAKDIGEIKALAVEIRAMLAEHAIPWYVKLWRKINAVHE